MTIMVAVEGSRLPPVAVLGVGALVLAISLGLVASPAILNPSIQGIPQAKTAEETKVKPIAVPQEKAIPTPQNEKQAAMVVTFISMNRDLFARMLNAFDFNPVHTSSSCTDAVTNRRIPPPRLTIMEATKFKEDPLFGLECAYTLLGVYPGTRLCVTSNDPFKDEEKATWEILTRGCMLGPEGRGEHGDYQKFKNMLKPESSNLQPQVVAEAKQR